MYSSISWQARSEKKVGKCFPSIEKSGVVSDWNGEYWEWSDEKGWKV